MKKRIKITGLVLTLFLFVLFSLINSAHADYLDNWNVRNSGTTHDLYSVCYGNNKFLAVGDAYRILTSTDGQTWTAQSPPSSATYWGVTYGNGLFVAVGQWGTILTSPDGETWTQQTSGTSNLLYSVTYGGGL